MTGLQVYRRLLGYAFKYKTALVFAACFMPVAAMGEAGVVYITKLMMDEGFVSKNRDVLYIAPIGLVLVIAGRGIAGFFAQWSIGWAGRRVIFDIRNQLFDRMLRLPTSYFDHHASSSLISKLIYDVEQLANAATNVIFTVIKDSLTVLTLVGWMAFISWKLTLLFIVVSPVATFIVRKMGLKLRATSKNIQASMSGIVKAAQEAVNGQKIIKTYGAVEYELRRFEEANNYNRRQVMKQQTVSFLGTPIIESVAAVAVATVVYVALSESMQNRMTVGQFTSYLSAMMLMLAPARRLTNANQVVQRGIAACQSAFSLLDEEPEPDAGLLELSSITGKIEYRDVCFRYQQSEKQVLQNVSFIIEPGTMVALVGASGSGKSTIASLLARFYEIEQGQILLDENDIKDLRLSSLREHIGLISQETILFDDTIANNISYGQIDDLERLHAAARAAHVLNFSDSLPDKLDTMVGEKGLRLSGGQRQRIAIARAIYKNAPILIMDEATSALDTESERHVQEALENLMSNRSTLVIAHRLSTIEKADRIIVMSNGKIVESGSHSDLISRNGAYAKLHQLQFSEIPEQA